MEQLKIAISEVADIVSSADVLRLLNFEELKAEVSALDFSAKAELAATFDKHFELENEEVEIKIEKGFDILLTAITLVKNVLQKKK